MEPDAPRTIVGVGRGPTMRSGHVVVVAVLLGVAGCGDDDDDGSSSTAGDEGATVISATAAEFSFTPSSWTIPAGEPVTVEITNEGTTTHEWVVVVMGQEITSGAEFTEDKVLFEVEGVPAGESEEGEVTIDAPGTYQVVCGIEGHFDAGMAGTLVVE
jgi:uncharacterized cupredoxin-like copper-binding protein